MPKGVYDRKPKDQSMAIETAAPQPSEKMFPVKLLKNYRPVSDQFEVVGYHRKEIVQKDTAGRVVVVQEAGFMEGEMAPAPFPGVGFDTKVWADTVLKLPMEEAKRLVSKNLAERADALPG